MYLGPMCLCSWPCSGAGETVGPAYARDEPVAARHLADPAADWKRPSPDALARTWLAALSGPWLLVGAPPVETHQRTAPSESGVDLVRLVVSAGSGSS